MAWVLTAPDLTGKPEAIGETIPPYCCSAWNGAMFCCLCIFSNCPPTCVKFGACCAIANCLALSVLYCWKAKGNACCATWLITCDWAKGEVGVLPAPVNWLATFP